jgi:Tol biopolymer transport system component
MRRLWPILVLGIAFWTALAPSRALGAETTLASISTAGGQGQFGNSTRAAVSSDGRFVAFEAYAQQLVPGDNGHSHVYLRDRVTPLTERMSISSAGAVANQDASHGSVSADGRYVVFQSGATNLVSPPTTFGRFNVYLRDRQAGTTALVSVTPAGDRGNQHSASPRISADGRYVAFESQATNLTVPPTNAWKQILRWDRLTGEIIQVSLQANGSQATAHCLRPSISGDGSRIAFHTLAGLEPLDDTGNQDIYLRDVDAGTTELVSVSSDGLHSGNLHSYDPAVSGDGGKVAFHSDAGNLMADTPNGQTHVYVRDCGGRTTYRASVSPGGEQGNAYSMHASINSDGSMVAFESAATNLVPGDTNGWTDVFLHRHSPLENFRVSVPDDALGDPEANAPCWYAAVSGDARYVAFESASTDLVAGDTNGFTDVFVRDAIAAAVGVATTEDRDAGACRLTVGPNPVRPGDRTDVRFDLPAAAPGRVTVYDVTGRPVRVLAAGLLASGPTSIGWDGRDERGRPVAQGVYFVRLETDRVLRTAKCVHQ